MSSNPSADQGGATPERFERMERYQLYCNVTIAFAAICAIAVTAWQGCAMRTQSSLMAEQLTAMVAQNDATVAANKVSQATADAARIAADAAMEANALASNIAQTQLQASLAVDDAEIKRDPTSGVTTFVARIKNFGQTPAYDVTSHAHFSYIAPGQLLRPVFTQVAQSGFSKSISGPGSSTPHRSQTLVKSQRMDQIDRGEINLEVALSIAFRDAFARHQASEFRFIWTGAHELIVESEIHEPDDYSQKQPPAYTPDAMPLPAPTAPPPD